MDLLTPSVQPHPAPALDALKVREDFPIFRRQVHGKPLVYLDSAATSLTPQLVIDAVSS